MAKTVFITGATSGFGKATAIKYAQNGNRLILTGRRNDRLETLKLELETKYNAQVLVLNFDVRDEKATTAAIENLRDTWKNIDVLVNNAGLASGLDPIQTGNFDDWNKMIDTNVKGLLYVSRAIIPLMIQQKSGHIVNIGSTAGKEVYPNGNVYCASKHAVDAITKGMRIDLLPHQIKVTQIAPGAANTEFSTVRFHGDEARADKFYQGFNPILAEDIAELIFYATSLPAHLCINDLVVTSTAQANSYLIHREENL
jgi:3-hydroxy acid dehydrogenase/malonic semialdehyde reductase